MLTHSHTVRIQWGDCDPLGIVFYPRYFAIFDDSTALLFQRALGISKIQLLERYASNDMPLVDARARFMIPAKFDDKLVVESGIREFRRSSFEVQHQIFKEGALAVEGIETRVWIIKDAQGTIKGHPIPQEIREAFEGE